MPWTLKCKIFQFKHDSYYLIEKREKWNDRRLDERRTKENDDVRLLARFNSAGSQTRREIRLFDRSMKRKKIHWNWRWWMNLEIVLNPWKMVLNKLFRCLHSLDDNIELYWENVLLNMDPQLIDSIGIMQRNRTKLKLLKISSFFHWKKLFVTRRQ